MGNLLFWKLNTSNILQDKINNKNIVKIIERYLSDRLPFIEELQLYTQGLKEDIDDVIFYDKYAIWKTNKETVSFDMHYKIQKFDGLIRVFDIRMDKDMIQRHGVFIVNWTTVI